MYYIFGYKELEVRVKLPLVHAAHGFSLESFELGVWNN